MARRWSFDELGRATRGLASAAELGGRGVDNGERWTAAAGAVAVAESENGVAAPGERGQDGVSKASEGFGPGILARFYGRAALSGQHAAATRCSALGEQHATATRRAASTSVGPVASFRLFERDRLGFGFGSLTVTMMPQSFLNKSNSQPHLKQVGHQVNPTSGKRDFWMNFKCIMHV